MKRLVSLVLCVSMLLSLVACGTPQDAAAPENPAENPEVTEQPASIEVEKELFDVSVTLPADLMGEITQEELEEDSEHFHSATLNEDGSVTFVMSKRQHKELLQELAASIREELDQMPGSENYPNVTKVEANEDFTVFTMTTTSEEPTLTESLSVMGFYIYGGMYGIFSGNDPENIHVDFVNAATGEVMASSDSSELANE